MKIIDTSVRIASKLFPVEYNKWGGGRNYHFAFLFERNTLISMGLNYPESTDGAILKFAKRFNVGMYKSFPYAHSELNAIKNVWARYHIGSHNKMVVLRLSKNGILRNSKPCRGCQTILDALSIDRIWFSTNEGKIIKYNNN